MDRQIFWVNQLITAIIGIWLWNQATAAVSGPLTPLLTFAAGVAVAGTSVRLARRAARIDGGRKDGRRWRPRDHTVTLVMSKAMTGT